VVAVNPAVTAVVLIVLALSGGTGFLYQTQAADQASKPPAGKVATDQQPQAGDRPENKNVAPPTVVSAGPAGSLPVTEATSRIAAAKKKLQESKDEKSIRDALDQLEQAVRDMKSRLASAKPTAGTEVKLFSLRNTKADEVAETLEVLFRTGSRTGPPTMKVRFAVHTSTNTLIVEGSSTDLGMVETIVTGLEDQPAN
jgi:hypothetical protein